MGDVVGADTDHHRFIFRPGVEQGFNRFVTQAGSEDAVISTWTPTALHMSQHGNADFLSQVLFQHPLDIRAANVIPIAVTRPFGDDDDMVTPPSLGASFQ